jgi:glycolate oxidase iron-sulfur subunit
MSSERDLAPTGPLADLHLGTLDCVHCGLCLQHCPTYIQTGRETSSPRGRIYLMRGVAEGEIPLGEVVAEEAALCLGCRACETACPSGVRYGALLEHTRARLAETGSNDSPGRRFERFALRQVVPHPKRLRALVSLLGLGQKLGLDRPVLRLMPSSLRDLAPRIPARADRRPLPTITPAEGPRRGRVGMLVGCIMPELFGAVNAATARVLAKNGFDVVAATDQGCCGALQAHAGDVEFARGLLARNVRAFSAGELDAVVVNSAGCGAFIRDHDHSGQSVSVQADGESAQADSRTPNSESSALGSKVRDISEFLDEVGWRAPLEELRLRVAYDDPCHLIHGQGVASAPRNLLGQIPGLELVQHAGASECCGAAGTYNLSQPEMSAAVLDRKMDALAAADPDVIASGNPGCIMQLRAGVQRRGLRARVVHPVELLDQACR